MWVELLVSLAPRTLAPLTLVKVSSCREQEAVTHIPIKEKLGLFPRQKQCSF